MTQPFFEPFEIFYIPVIDNADKLEKDLELVMSQGGVPAFFYTNMKNPEFEDMKKYMEEALKETVVAVIGVINYKKPFEE